MAHLTLDNIPTELLEQIQKRAQKEQISLQDQVLALLRVALHSPPSFTGALAQFQQSFPDAHPDDATVFDGLRIHEPEREMCFDTVCYRYSTS